LRGTAGNARETRGASLLTLSPSTGNRRFLSKFLSTNPRSTT